MRFRSLTALLVAVTGLVALSTAFTGPVASAVDVDDGAATVAGLTSGKAIVAVDGELSDDFLSELAALGVEQGLALPSIDAVAVTAPAEVLRQVADHDRVRAVQPQRRIHLDLNESVDQIGAREAYQSETYRIRGAREYERPAVSGDGVTVAVIDSGIFAGHPDLTGRVTGLNFELSSLSQGEFGVVPAEDWDAYVESTGPLALQDEVGHGTHVASTIGGSGEGSSNPDLDLRGVAPEVDFVSMKLASAANGIVEDFGFEENALAALDYLVRHPELGVTVANNSWSLLPYEPSSTGDMGFPTDYDAAAEIAREVVNAGITLVFAAGNSGTDPDGASTIGPAPNGIEEVVTVAAVCKTDPELGSDSNCRQGHLVSGFSSRGAADGTGPQVDVSAPGDNILAAVSPSVLLPLSRCSDRITEEPLYECLSGTSMASPHVAGVVALMQQASPGIAPAQVEECLAATADDLVDDDNGLTEGFDIHSGHGLVNTPAALTCVHQLTDPDSVGPGRGRPAR